MPQNEETYPEYLKEMRLVAVSCLMCKEPTPHGDAIGWGMLPGGCVLCPSCSESYVDQRDTQTITWKELKRRLGVEVEVDDADAATSD